MLALTGSSTADSATYASQSLKTGVMPVNVTNPGPADRKRTELLAGDRLSLSSGSVDCQDDVSGLLLRVCTEPIRVDAEDLSPTSNSVTAGPAAGLPSWRG